MFRCGKVAAEAAGAVGAPVVVAEESLARAALQYRKLRPQQGRRKLHQLTELVHGGRTSGEQQGNCLNSV